MASRKARRGYLVDIRAAEEARFRLDFHRIYRGARRNFMCVALFDACTIELSADGKNYASRAAE